MARRAEHVASTRDRIIAATTELYGQRGIAHTTIKDVAVRADVARATVLNHFGSRDALASAVLDGITESLAIPTDSIFDGVRSTAERLRRLVAAMFEFYDRSTPWFDLFREQYDSVPALKRGEQRFWQGIQALYAQALGPYASNKLTYGTVLGLTNPATLGALRQSGLSLVEASTAIGDVLVQLVNQPAPRPKRR
jgi:AcrR family transcriptional regulator